uniref:histidine kinase n=1 Tax=Candidatus Methanogaster sp. ANME-2c ERB4 TaxID=2759911 RepID=A0A7G9YQ48_9EURY|nr:hypothetical protein DMFPCFDI_00023 [Methanosarcinales archaeon ANME-2c ERB4]QNO50132.1 hypothetical protein GDOAKEED_00036 [Methanosarcinales archaeon ANME-2c ERB4]
MKIKYKVNLLIIILKIIMTLLVVASVNFVVGQVLEEEMRDKDLAISELLASEIANPLLDKNDLRVQEIIDDLKRQNADVRYAYVVGFDETVVAHTFKEGFPVELVTANRVPSGEDDAIKILSAEGESIQDVGVRVLEGMDAKVYIGFSRARLFETIARTTHTILGIAALVLLFGIVLNSFLMRRLIKPIEALVEGTKRVGDGDLDFRIDVVSCDELGNLTEAFNQMTAERKCMEDALERSEAFLNETGHMAKVGGWEIDAETRDVRWTDETYHIHEVPLGYKPPLDEVINFFHPEDRLKLEHAIQRALDHGEPYNMEIRFITAGGKHLWTHTICKPHIVDGRTVKLTGTFQDITERKTAEERIEHLNSVLKAIRDVNQLIVTEKERGSLLKKVCNVLIEARGYEVVCLGYLSDGETFDRVVGSGLREDVDRFCESVVDGNHPLCIKKALAGKEMVMVTDKSGECGDCPFKDADAGRETAVIRIERESKLFGLLAIALAADVTLDEEEEGLLAEVASDIALALHNMELEESRKSAEYQIKASLKEKEVLLQEIHHRVKNNLQIVSSLLDMQARGARNREVIDALAESRNRLNAMVLIHAQLYEHSDLSEINMKGFVNRLLVQLLQSYPVQDTKITPIVSVADYPFPISMAVPVGLSLNELLSNALKHAFVDRKEGTIKVSLTASEEGKIDLIVSDDGVGLPPGFDINATRTLGLRLVKILTEDQLQGTLEVTGDCGATFKMEFDITDD